MIAMICCLSAVFTQENERIEECPCEPVFECACTNTATLEFRASYFRPYSKALRESLNDWAVDYALEATIPVWRGLNVWSAVDYFSKSGKTAGFNKPTHLTIVPLTLGLKYIFSINRYYGIYAGGGARYYFVEMVNRVFPIYRTTHRYGFGGIVEFGNMICISDHFLIDIFASCSFKKVDGLGSLPPNATSEKLDVGGWNIGAGIGYKF